MSMIKKTITITAQQEAFIQRQLATGHYASESELIREALREKELRNKLIASEECGLSNRTPEQIRAAAKGRLGPHGQA